MTEQPAVRAAIIDLGIGNLFSVAQSCEAAGMRPEITDDPHRLDGADLVILPGVGAFGDAMDALREHGMDEALRDIAAAGRPLWGICLGLQLLADVSFEMGEHSGLGIIPGAVRRLPQAEHDGRAWPKVPRVGWSPIAPSAGGPAWEGTPLDVVDVGTWFYFVHSFHLVPADAAVTIAETEFRAGIPESRYCAAVQRGSVFATQFHPERSGVAGQRMYRRMADLTRRRQPPGSR